MPDVDALIEVAISQARHDVGIRRCYGRECQPTR